MCVGRRNIVGSSESGESGESSRTDEHTLDLSKLPIELKDLIIVSDGDLLLRCLRTGLDPKRIQYQVQPARYSLVEFISILPYFPERRSEWLGLHPVLRSFAKWRPSIQDGYDHLLDFIVSARARQLTPYCLHIQGNEGLSRLALVTEIIKTTDMVEYTTSAPAPAIPLKDSSKILITGTATRQLHDLLQCVAGRNNIVTRELYQPAHSGPALCQVICLTAGPLDARCQRYVRTVTFRVGT